MKDWIKIREILKNIQNRQNKNQAIYGRLKRTGYFMVD